MRFHPIRLLLLVPFMGVLWPPIYNRIDPMLANIPFFYWYQMAWIFVTAILLWLIHRVEKGGKQ